MTHFGRGGMVDYILREVHWYTTFGYRDDLIVGLSKSSDLYRHWNMTREKFTKSGMKISVGMRIA